ncbi:hypothetical protein ACVDFE_02175 [Lentzea chajnantorensis]
MLIEHPHFVHPADVELADKLRGPLADSEDARHLDYVALGREWLRQHLIGEYHRHVLADPGRWTGHDEPELVELTEQPLTDADGRDWALPYELDGVSYNVGWMGRLVLHQHPEWTE